jgi:hypothetical protein
MCHFCHPISYRAACNLILVREEAWHSVKLVPKEGDFFNLKLIPLLLGEKKE